MAVKKKVFLGVLAAVALVAVAAAAIFVVRVPNLTIYYDSDGGEAFSVQTKTGVVKKVELPGYEKVSFVTPFDGGYYCRAQKDGQNYLILVRDGQVESALPEPVYGAEQVVEEMCASQDGLYISCSTLEQQKVLFADFANGQVTELPLDGSQSQSCLSARGSTVLLGRSDNSVARIYRYQSGRAQELVRGTEPVLLSETQFLYTDENDNLQLYDLTAGASQPAPQKTDFSLYDGMEWSKPATADGKWLAGWRAGIPFYDATAPVGGITLTDMDSGKTYCLPTTLGRRASHLQAVSGT